MNILVNGEAVCLLTHSTEQASFEVFNSGTASLTNVEVAINIPAGLTVLSNTPSQGSYAAGVWNVGTLTTSQNADNPETLELCFTVTDDSLSPFTITATLTHDDMPDDVDSDNVATREIAGFRCSEFAPCVAATLATAPNFANTDLVVDANRAHDGGEFNMTLENFRQINLEVTESAPAAEDGQIRLNAYSSNGEDRLLISGGDISMVKNYGGHYSQVLLNTNGYHLIQSEGKYLIGDGAGFGIGDPPTDSDATHNLVWESTTSRLGKAVRPKIFKAILNQTGTTDPSLVASFDNTLGEVPTYSRGSDGVYTINTVGNVFTANKTFVTATLMTTATAVGLKAGRTSNTAITINTYDGAGVLDDLVGDIQILIEVYP
jgi:hypothetical protein